MLSHPKSFIPFFSLCALLTAGGLAAAEPAAQASTSSTEADSGAQPSPAMSGSTMAWNPELQVFQAPDPDQMRRIAEDLQAALLQLPFATTKAEKVQVRDGIYRMRAGTEAMSLSMRKLDAEGNPIAACVQVGSLLNPETAPAMTEEGAVKAPKPAVTERPKSLPATEGWVAQ